MEKKSSFASNLIYFIVVCLFVVIRLCGHFGVFSFMGEVGNYIINLTLQVGILFLIPLILFKSITKQGYKSTFKNFGYKKISFKVVLISIAIGVVVYVLNIFISSFFYSIITGLGYKSQSVPSGSSSVFSLFLSLIFTAILPAICEEHLHRGMLLYGNKNLGVVNNILLTGLLFGLLHLNIEQFFYATLIGFLLGFIAYCTNSIFPCMIIHFMNNAISVCMSFAHSNGWSLGTRLTNLSNNNALLGFILIFLFIFLLVFCLLKLIKLLLAQSFEDNVGAKQRAVEDLMLRFGFFQSINKLKNETSDCEDEQKTEILYSIQDINDFIQQIGKKNEKQEKMELKTKIFLWGSIILSTVITFFTFLWGIL